MNLKRGHIEAFTLFEVMMVLAIMGVLITIISLSLNRFNEQLKVSNDVQQELNSWYRFRANLWRELYHSDSMKLETGEFKIYMDQRIVDYKVEEDSLFRKSEKEEWRSTGFMASSIRKEEKNDDQLYFIDFIWKNDVMTLSYLDHRSTKNKIDSYFEQL